MHSYTLFVQDEFVKTLKFFGKLHGLTDETVLGLADILKDNPQILKLLFDSSFSLNTSLGSLQEPLLKLLQGSAAEINHSALSPKQQHDICLLAALLGNKDYFQNVYHGRVTLSMLNAAVRGNADELVGDFLQNRGITPDVSTLRAAYVANNNEAIKKLEGDYHIVIDKQGLEAWAAEHGEVDLLNRLRKEEQPSITYGR